MGTAPSHVVALRRLTKIERLKKIRALEKLPPLVRGGDVPALADLIEAVTSWHPLLGDQGFLDDLTPLGAESFHKAVAAVQGQVRKLPKSHDVPIGFSDVPDAIAEFTIDLPRYALHRLLYPEGGSMQHHDEQVAYDTVDMIASDMRLLAINTIPRVKRRRGRPRRREDAAYWAIIAVCLYRSRQGLSVQYDFKAVSRTVGRCESAEPKQPATAHHPNRRASWEGHRTVGSRHGSCRDQDKFKAYPQRAEQAPAFN